MTATQSLFAESLRRAVVEVCGTTRHKCYVAAAAARILRPDAIRWSGVVRGESHVWVEIDGVHVDVTGDQFGLDEILIDAELPDEYRSAKAESWGRGSATEEREAVAVAAIAAIVVKT